MGLFNRKDRMETPESKARKHEATARGIRAAAGRSRNPEIAAELERIAQANDKQARLRRAGR
jgi:hypothetical protein